MTSKTTNKCSAEVRDHAVRMVLDHKREHPWCWAAIVSIAAKIGCTGQTRDNNPRKGLLIPASRDTDLPSSPSESEFPQEAVRFRVACQRVRT